MMLFCLSSPCSMKLPTSVSITSAKNLVANFKMIKHNLIHSSYSDCLGGPGIPCILSPIFRGNNTNYLKASSSGSMRTVGVLFPAGPNTPSLCSIILPFSLPKHSEQPTGHYQSVLVSNADISSLHEKSQLDPHHQNRNPAMGTTRCIILLSPLLTLQSRSNFSHFPERFSNLLGLCSQQGAEGNL